MTSAEEVLSLALQLPEPARATVAHELLLSLQPDGPDDGWEGAWQAEIARRLERVDRGEHTAVDWREALAEIRANLRRRPKP